MIVFRIGSDLSGSADIPDRPNGGLYAAYSQDDAHTWGQPRLLNGTPTVTGQVNNPHRVEPKLARLPATGAILLASGRPGLFVYVVPEASLVPGREHEALWEAFDVRAAHDKMVRPRSWSFFDCGLSTDTGNSASGSTFYTSMSVFPDEDRIVLSYDHAHSDSPGCGFDLIFTMEIQVARRSSASLRPARSKTI